MEAFRPLPHAQTPIRGIRVIRGFLNQGAVALRAAIEWARGELQKLERHFDKFAFYELDQDYSLARDLVLKMHLKGADEGILAVAAGLARRERVWVQFISADQEQLRAARQLAHREKLRVVSLPAGLA